MMDVMIHIEREHQGNSLSAVRRSWHYLIVNRVISTLDLGRLLGDRALSKTYLKILAKHFNVSPAVLLD